MSLKIYEDILFFFLCSESYQILIMCQDRLSVIHICIMSLTKSSLFCKPSSHWPFVLCTRRSVSRWSAVTTMCSAQPASSFGFRSAVSVPPAEFPSHLKTRAEKSSVRVRRSLDCCSDTQCLFERWGDLTTSRHVQGLNVNLLWRIRNISHLFTQIQVHLKKCYVVGKVHFFSVI